MLDMVRGGRREIRRCKRPFRALRAFFICQLSHVKELTKLFGRVLFNFCRFCGKSSSASRPCVLGDVADNHLDSAVQRRIRILLGMQLRRAGLFHRHGPLGRALGPGHPESRHRAEQSPANLCTDELLRP